MKIYVWDDVDGITSKYHDGGGVLIIAATLERAIAMLHETCPDGYQGTDESLRTSVRVVDPNKESISVFPNAGCC